MYTKSSTEGGSVFQRPKVTLMRSGLRKSTEIFVVWSNECSLLQVSCYQNLINLGQL
jgi:hypothetical protein